MNTTWTCLVRIAGQTAMALHATLCIFTGQVLANLDLARATEKIG